MAANFGRPPPYSEDLHGHRHNEPEMKVHRKPVPKAPEENKSRRIHRQRSFQDVWEGTRQDIPRRTSNQDIRKERLQDGNHQNSGNCIGDPKTIQSGRIETSGSSNTAMDVQARPELSLETSIPAPISGSPLFTSPESTVASTIGSSGNMRVGSASTASSFPSPESINPESSSSSKSSTSSYVQKAFQEARHFAGGLIHHPSESTKHFSVLRHSHGLVFYQGTNTSLALSVFADAPLPDNRTLWLQSKGWSGKTGMRARAFVGRNGNWLNITPTIEIIPEQLNPHDERAWQRDIASFQKRSKPHISNYHLLRETVVLRIPADAGDGYFQVVMCQGEKKKVLCSSPVFRLLSVSSSPHSIRGASLKTLPLELGAMALGTYAKTTAGTVASPVTTAVQSQVQNYMPSWWIQEAASTAYGVTGAENKIDSTVQDANTRFEQRREGSFESFGGVELEIERGPKAPYPICFTARTGSEKSGEAEGSVVPTITLARVADNILRQFHGYYFGWCRFFGGKKHQSPNEGSWLQVVLSALPPDPALLARANFSEASRKTFTLHVIFDPDNVSLHDTSVDLRVMGFLRPDEPSQRASLRKGMEAGDGAADEARMVAEVKDISIAQYFLDHPAWAPEVVEETSLAEKSAVLEKAKTGYASTRMAAQRHIDRVPLHKFGIRTETDRMKDKTIVTNGFYVVR